MNTFLLAGMTLVTLASGGGYALLLRRRLVNELEEREAASAETIRTLEAEVVGLREIAERLAAGLPEAEDGGDPGALAGLRAELEQLLRNTEEVRAESGERAERLAAQLAQLGERLEGNREASPVETDSAASEDLENERLRAEELAAELAALRSATEEEALRSAREHAEELERFRHEQAELEARLECTRDLLKKAEAGSGQASESDGVSAPALPSLTQDEEPFSEPDPQIDGPARSILDLIVQLDACAVGSPERRTLVAELDQTLLGMRETMGLNAAEPEGEEEAREAPVAEGPASDELAP